MPMRPCLLLLLALCLPSVLTAAPQDPQEVPKVLDPDQSCTTRCHQDRTAGEFLHGPVADDSCSECHMQDDESKHEFFEIADIAQHCAMCHEMEFEAHLHGPVADGDCTTCHDPHGAPNKALLNAPDQASLCAACHDSVAANTRKDFVHGPVAAGQCTLCHNAHSAAEPFLLDLESGEFCLQCHEHQAAAIEEAENVHGPVAVGCAPCHDPHGSDYRFMVRDETQAMCLGCHSELGDAIGSLPVSHGALDLEDSCLTCHRAHESRFPVLLSQTVEENCRQCHQDEIQRPDAKPISAIGELLDGSQFLHGPIQEGDCTGCHGAHASAHTDLLVEEYPRLFYSPYRTENYEICFNCHERKVFETPKTESLTRFRDGDNNLHYVHVSRETKGRTCRACHEVHGSNLPHHMATSVPFGKWDLPVGYSQIPNGGSCLPGCHKRFDYVPSEPILEATDGR